MIVSHNPDGMRPQRASWLRLPNLETLIGHGLMRSLQYTAFH
jgi:hypothetical protein